MKTFLKLAGAVVVAEVVMVLVVATLAVLGCDAQTAVLAGGASRVVGFFAVLLS